MIATDKMVWDNQINAIMDEDKEEPQKATWGDDIADIMDGKDHPKSIPKLGACSKDTAKLHKEKPKQEQPARRAARVPRARSTEDGPSPKRSEKSPLRRCHTTDAADAKRASPRGTRRGRRPPSELASSTNSQGTDSGDPERGRSAQSLSPPRSKGERRPRSNSPIRRAKEKSSADRRVRDILKDDTEEEADRSSRSRSASPNRAAGGRRSPGAGLPPKNPSTGSRSRREGSPRSGNSPMRRPRDRSPKNSSSGRSGLPDRAKSTDNLPVRRGAIEARRQKSSRTLGLRKTKSLDESSGDLGMNWRRARNNMNASSSGNFKLEQSSSNFLESSSGAFLDQDLLSDSEEFPSIDMEVDDPDDSNKDNSNNNKDGNSSPTSSRKGGARGGSPRSRRHGGGRHGGGRNDVSYNQLARGIELQDQRVRQEEEEEARRKRHHLKKQNSTRNRSRSPMGSSSGRQEGDSNARPLIGFAAPKIAVPNITLASPTILTDTAAAASQAATAAGQAMYGTANAASQAATAASQSAYQAAMGSAAAASQAANVMSGAAARAAAALTFTTDRNSPVLGPSPKPINQNKSTVSERELASRFNFNSKAGSSSFGKPGSSAFGGSSSFAKPGSSAFGSASLRESTNSDKPSRNNRSQEFTAGNGLELF